MKRVMVIGWDSSDFRLILPWIKDGYLPNLKKLIDTSKYGTLTSVYPPVTPIAWSTIVTGKNAGKHNISGFMKFRNNSYETYPVSATERRGKDVWEILSDYGKKVAVIGVPMTFPVRRVNGCMVSGFLTPNESVNYCYPKELKQEIASKIPGYTVSPSDFFKNFNDFASTGGDERSVKSVFETLQKHIDAMVYIAETKEWDFFMGVFNETDWLQHRFWSCIDKDHPRYNQKRAQKFENVIRDVHTKLDEALEQLTRIASDAHIMLISDHGVGPLHWNMNTNYHLYKMGALQFKKSPGSIVRLVLARLGFSYSFIIRSIGRLKVPIIDSAELKKESQENNRSEVSLLVLAKRIARHLILSDKDIDWSKTVAFARYGHGEIFLNKEDYFPSGIINTSGYSRKRSEITSQLREVRNGNTSVIEKVFLKEDIFSGKYTEHCPDIQIHPVEGYVPLGGFPFGLRKGFILPEASYAGHHSMNGIFILREIGCEPSSKIIQGAKLVDIVPTILHLMQVPSTSDLDGRSLAESSEIPPMTMGDHSTEANNEGQVEYTEEEEKDVEERLRSLGYI